MKRDRIRVSTLVKDWIRRIIRSFVELDYMEYATDAAAQAEYVTNASYGSDVCTGGTATGSYSEAGYEPSKAFDNNAGTNWYSNTTSGWIKYNLGVGVTKTATKYTIQNVNGQAASPKNWTFQGSNNDSDWTTLDTQTNQNTVLGDSAVHSYTFSNAIAYRYYRWNISAVGSANTCYITELEIMEGGYLLAYSESTIKTQGSYSLKGVAVITDSLNKTLTRTVSPTIDLSNQTQIKYWIRALRTGSNFKIGWRDSGLNVIEHTPNILVSNEWQEETVDISAVSNANKDAIDRIIFTVLDADATNIVYLDNMLGESFSFNY